IRRPQQRSHHIQADRDSHRDDVDALQHKRRRQYQTRDQSVAQRREGPPPTPIRLLVLCGVVVPACVRLRHHVVLADRLANIKLSEAIISETAEQSSPSPDRQGRDRRRSGRGVRRLDSATSDPTTAPSSATTPMPTSKAWPASGSNPTGSNSSTFKPISQHLMRPRSQGRPRGYPNI